MDSLIGKPFFSNAAGAVLDPATGVELTPSLIGGDTNTIGRLDSFNISMEGVESPMVFARDQVATPEISQAEIDASKLAQIKYNEELGRRVAQRDANLESSRLAEAQRLAQIEAQKAALLSTPIVVSTTTFPSVGGGGGGGGGGGFGGGGGGGGEPSSKSSNGSTTTTAKPSFLKKNFVPLLLIAGAIFIFVKKPI
jgi:hypothetical protein